MLSHSNGGSFSAVIAGHWQNRIANKVTPYTLAGIMGFTLKMKKKRMKKKRHSFSLGYYTRMQLHTGENGSFSAWLWSYREGAMTLLRDVGWCLRRKSEDPADKGGCMKSFLPQRQHALRIQYRQRIDCDPMGFCPLGVFTLQAWGTLCPKFMNKTLILQNFILHNL